MSVKPAGEREEAKAAGHATGARREKVPPFLTKLDSVL